MNGKTIRDIDGIGTVARLYSIDQTSQLLNISQKSVRRLISRGLLKCSRALRHIRISDAAINEFITNSTE